MPQRFLKNSTMKVAEVLQKTISELANMRKGLVTSEFLLLTLFEQKDSIVVKLLIEMGLDVESKRGALTEAVLDHLNTVPPLQLRDISGSLRLSKDVSNLFEAAERERSKFGDGYISTGTLFLAFFDRGVPGTAQLLKQIGIDYEKTKDALKTLRGNQKINQKDSESRQSTLDEYTTDMTALARRGTLDPVLGRDEEILRVIEILARRKKNNPILVGEPGVGKTVIVEGLAQKIVSADVPEFLLNKRILSLEMGTLIAGAKMQGEFEERLKSIRDEIAAAAGNIILFIDEIHTVVGAGRSGGGLDASNMLKPALANGLLQCVGATTNREFKKYIESDKALERRFQKVKVGEPTVEETIQILRGIRPKYEAHHQIEYSDDALQAAAQLSHRYIQSRQLPDKAIDLLDEAGSSKRIKVIYTPPEMRAIETERQKLDESKLAAFNERDFEKMASFQMQLAILEGKIQEQRDKSNSSLAKGAKIVTADDIAHVVSQQTGIPVKKMIAEEREKLKQLEVVIRERVIGQDHAVHSVANAIRRNRSGLRRRKAPIASFLFLGPTGVGKTELAKALAAQVLDDESKIVRLDMSEYMERHDVAKLIGSPPGYVGYGEGGQLTEKIKNNPYSVVLLDEFEKAHPDVFNVLLQILDDGRLTDGEGETVSFENCIIVGTSNIGSSILMDKKKPVGLSVSDDESFTTKDLDAVMAEVKKSLRPELINRFDEIIVFHRLDQPEFSKILDIQIKELQNKVKDLGFELTVSPEARLAILASIDSNQYGARPLRRKLESTIENQIANFVIENEGGTLTKIVVDAEQGEIVIRRH
jgi:ATP-dependent Clp protease ATP-binding subunit ClpC